MVVNQTKQASKSRMNRGKEPPLSLCEKKFMLDTIKESKVGEKNELWVSCVACSCVSVRTLQTFVAVWACVVS